MRRLLENLSSIFWFLMDVFWSCGWDGLAISMIVPTVYSTMLMFKHTQLRILNLLVCTATNSWVLMNVCWMVPDVFDGAWTPYVFMLRWVFLVTALLSMVAISCGDVSKLRNIKRFRS